MSRNSQTKSTDIQSQLPTDGIPTPGKVAAPEAKMPLVWKVVLIVWMGGFFGLGLYEAWHLLGGMFRR